MCVQREWTVERAEGAYGGLGAATGENADELLAKGPTFSGMLVTVEHATSSDATVVVVAT